MSKIGKLPVEIPDKVGVILEGNHVKVTGPKGTLERKFPREVAVRAEGKKLLLSIKRKDKRSMSLYGTSRAILSNMIKGVSDGWQKKLELVGTGYRAEVQGNALVLTVGYINPVRVVAPKDVSFKVEKSLITVDGIDKEVVGEMAARIRKVRPPEPYQGKGIRYADEVVRKKPGKAAKGTEAA